MTSLKNQVVLITGASSGIGRALAYELAKRGAHLILIARRLDRLQKLASELQPFPSRVVLLQGDVTIPGSIEAGVEKGVKELGKLDIVIANAGYNVRGSLEELTLDDYRRQFETNVFGVLRTIYASLAEIKKSKGSLVLIGSLGSYISLPNTSAYSMSKSAIQALADALSGELNSARVSVTLITPGMIVSEIRDVDKFGVYHPGKSEQNPSLLRMPADLAAQKMVDAIAGKKREKIITIHAKIGVWVKRFFPGMLAFLINQVFNRKIKRLLPP